ncbi:MAG TPA: hypothetical protein VNM90_04440 [Haliangium sp.]|nr:hypothetical protein [Haliangium sp.]
MRISPIGILACGLALSACSLYFEQDPGDPDDDRPGNADPCELAGPDEWPGFPFDVAEYQQVIWPMTQRTCSRAACHDSSNGASFDFLVWADNGDVCAMIRSFNDFYANSDFVEVPENSAVLRALDGRVPHPVFLGPGTAEYDVLLEYIVQAWSRFQFDTPAPYFDAYVFEQQIQPMLDEAACTASGCHDPISSTGGFALYPFPAPGSQEMSQNLQSVARYVDFQVPPESTELYQRAAGWHGSIVSSPELLLAWIQAAYDAMGR